MTVERLEYLHQVESILGADIPLGHPAEQTVWEDADNADSCNWYHDAQRTADLLRDQVAEFERHDQ